MREKQNRTESGRGKMKRRAGGKQGWKVRSHVCTLDRGRGKSWNKAEKYRL